MEMAVVSRPSALANASFRRLLLVLTGVPIGALYLWRGLVMPLAGGTDLGDFFGSYLPAAAKLVAQKDPYDLCRTMGCLEPTGPQYVTPSLLAWLLQPVVGTSRFILVVGVVLVLNASLALFLFTTLRALKVRRWEMAVLLVLVALSFGPVIGNLDEGQVNLVLLALSGLWLWSWVADSWWGGIALGATVALKVIQGPVGLVVLWGRRWTMLLAAAATGIALSLIAVPQYLAEYLLKVLPDVAQGTGLYENHSPGGTITRLFEPATFFGAVRGSPAAARALTLAVALAAVLITFAVLRRPAKAWTARGLEAAAIVAVTPLVTSYSWGTHLVLLLLPMLVLVEWGVRNQDWLVLGLVALGSLLIGPGGKLLQTLLVSGYTNLVVLRVMAEFGVVAVTAIWVASLLAVRRERAAASLHA